MLIFHTQNKSVSALPDYLPQPKYAILNNLYLCKPPIGDPKYPIHAKQFKIAEKIFKPE